MGFDRETAGEFFRECSRELLLLDTGSDAHVFGELEAMARYLGLPCRSRYVGLDYLRHFLSGAIAKWRNLAAEAKTREILAQVNRKVADYAMAFDLLVRLSHITDEDATIAAIQELFAMLFALIASIEDASWPRPGRQESIRARAQGGVLLSQEQKQELLRVIE
ncbi:hypothetical protein [Thiocapsa sp.]|uniref:hypothetical protein n=1 Tax=Thiocapsa sp. TaxID=2024551 RepID=UPI0035934074